MLRQSVVMTVLAAGMVGSGYAAIYSCKDAGGQVSYQDQPCSASKEQTEIVPPATGSNGPLCSKVKSHPMADTAIVYFA